MFRVREWAGWTRDMSCVMSLQVKDTCNLHEKCAKCTLLITYIEVLSMSYWVLGRNGAIDSPKWYKSINIVVNIPFGTKVHGWWDSSLGYVLAWLIHLHCYEQARRESTPKVIMNERCFNSIIVVSSYANFTTTFLSTIFVCDLTMSWPNYVNITHVNKSFQNLVFVGWNQGYCEISRWLKMKDLIDMR